MPLRNGAGADHGEGVGWALAWAFLLLALAFCGGYLTTRGLTWPNESDLYRDLASAQGLLREGFGHDPNYLGESLSYNPLTHLTVAGIHKVTGLPLEVILARGGTYLNLAAPIAFFILAFVLFVAWTALLALAGFLFCVGGSFPSWSAATYSPWLYPGNFSQTFFYLLVLVLASLRGARPTWRWALLAGAVWGVTFMAHAAPAVLFAGLFSVLLAGTAWQDLRANPRGLARLVGCGLLMVAVFTLVCLPFLQSIVGRYGLHTVNPMPRSLVVSFLGFRMIPDMVWQHLQPPVLVAWYGLYVVVRGAGDPPARRLLLAWFGVAAAFVLYGYVCAGAAKLGVILPAIVPSFHFLLYLKAVLCLFFAVGLLDLARRLVFRLTPKPGPQHVRVVRRLGFLLALGLVCWSLPDYLARYDFAKARSEAALHGLERDRIALYRWTLENTLPTDVFLASNDLALFCLAPAGAKVVAVDPYFSNPYVDWETRNQARARMYECLAQGRAEEFSALAREHQVSYVVDEQNGRSVAPVLTGSVLEEVFVSGPLRVHRVAAEQ